MAIHKKPRNLLSVIVPCFRQEKTIKKDLARLKETLEKFKIQYEIIVVVDGYVDKSFIRAKEVKSPNIIVVGYEHNHGKGYAIRFGMSKAKGNIIAFVDAGMDLDPKYLLAMLNQMEINNADIIVGSKLHPWSKVSYPIQRKLLSVCYRFLVKTLFGLSISDTQVGMKLFKRNVLKKVLPRLLVKTFAFDIEMLAVSNYLGYKRIYESPIELKSQKFSSITSKSFIRIVSSMLKDTFAVYYRLKLLHYYDNTNKRKWKYDPELNFRVNI